MAYKLLTRLGLLTGTIVGTTHLGIWAEPEQISESLKNPNEMESEKSVLEFPIHELCVIAQNDYNNAIKRGFYFSHRLHDWKKGFLKHTANIMYEENTLTETSTDIALRSKDHTPRASIRNSRSTDFPMTKHPKPPMIKDDVTCRKRELA